MLLPAASFKPRRDQRQAINRWNKFVLGEKYSKEVAERYPKSREAKAIEKQDFDLIASVHESEYDCLRRPPEPDHKFEITLEPDNFTEEKYQLFENYQQHVHHEPKSVLSRSGFRRFLCSSPLQRTTHLVNGGTEQKLGSFHQCYRLDGRLIAMGVLDLLPRCVSGVYFIYHSDFEKWSFGKLSALREAALALEGGYQYYYMGFYIHSCAKMRYKGDYKPQYVLDPDCYEWHVLDEHLLRSLDARKYVSVSRERRLEESGDAPSSHADAQKHPSTEDVDEMGRTIFATPSEATQSGLSLFEIAMPGVMSVQQLEDSVDLGQVLIALGRGRVVRLEDLVAWETGSLQDNGTLKGMIAELAACVGPDVSRGMVVKMGPD